MLVDTHCHIHEPSYPLDAGDVLRRADEAGVKKLICVGTSEESSRQAVEFAARHDNVFASIGVHPHDTKDGWGKVGEILAMTQASRLPSAFTKYLQPEFEATSGPEFKPGAKPFRESEEQKGEHENTLVAIGEIGLDYFYTHSPRDTQIQALEEQIDLALKYDLPVIFHVREAFDDFWPIFDNFQGIRGELHSFTDTRQHMEQALERGLYIGVNGISTFTKDDSQRVMFSHIPLEKLLLETDAPFLTPIPFRGKINEPAFVKNIADFHAEIRGVSPEEIARSTTANAHALFALS